MGSIPGSERSPGGGLGNTFQCSSLENSIDRGVWWDMVHRVTESNMTEVAEYEDEGDYFQFLTCRN